MRKRLPRPSIRGAVPLMPSGFTLANLFFGIWAIIAAARGDFKGAGLYVVLGGVCDALDGRVARATRTGSRFGEELDSLVDAVSFGVAPAMIMYHAVLNEVGFDWIWAFIFAAAAVIRLAKFNVEHAGRAKTQFYGLPSPAAGMTLATYYWFSQTKLYDLPFIAELPWQSAMRYLMLLLSVLMISNVQYPALPVVGLRSARGILGTLVVLGTIIGVLFFRFEFFFPALVLYVLYGLVKTAAIGLLERRGSAEDEDEDEDEREEGLIRVQRGAGERPPTPQGSPASEREGSDVQRRRRRRRRRGGGGSGGAGGDRGRNS